MRIIMYSKQNGQMIYRKRNRLRVLLLFAIFLTFSLLQAQNQSQPISLNLQNVTLKDFFEQIESKTSFTIVYRDVLMDNKKDVSVNVTNRPLGEVLNIVLSKKELQASFANNTIVITSKEAEKKSNAVNVSGVILDVERNPIIGATVRAKGTSVGTITDTNGNFQLEVAQNAVLAVSYLGFQTQEVAVAGKSSFNITLQEDNQLLNEVVVVGYGTQKKVNLSGAVSQVTSKELENRPAANMSQLLQGVVPNMNVTFGSGRPGASGSFNIRGNTSITGGTPLILIDGIEGNIDRINPRDVESVSVLKDASASAVYGARASYGVILVTTKQGSESKTNISYGGKFGFGKPTTSTDFETRGYYSAKINDMFFSSYAGNNYTKYTDADYEQLWLRVNDKTEHPDRPWVVIDQRDGRDTYVYYGNTDWYNYFFDDTRPTQEHNVNISGGNNKVKYFLSGGLYEQEGVFRIKPDVFRSLNYLSKITVDLHPWLQFSNNTKYYHSSYDYPGYSGIDNAFNNLSSHALASFVPVNPDGTPTYITSLTDYQITDGWSAMYTNNGHNNLDKVFEFTTIFEAALKLFKGFEVRANYSYSHYNSQVMNHSVNIPYSKYPGVVEYIRTDIGLNRLYERHRNYWYQTTNVYANYETQIAQEHNLKVLFGANYENRYTKNNSISRQGLLSDELHDFNLAVGDDYTIGGGQEEYSIAGLFARLNYDYKGRYLLEASGRYDASSRFMREHRGGYFPSASVAWRISEEAFFVDVKELVSNAKIRVSYGSLGNQVTKGLYDYVRTVDTGGTLSYSFGDGLNAPSATVSTPHASDLTWEVVTTKNLGLDLGFFKDKLNFTGDFYVRETKGMLKQGVKLPAVYGANPPQQNRADMETTGWGISLAWRDNFSLLDKPFNYNVRAILSDYTAVMTKFHNPTKSLLDYYEGQQLGEIWGYRIGGYFESDDEAANYNVNQTAVNDIIISSAGSEMGLKAGDLKYLDLDDNHVIGPGANTLDDHGDREVIGNYQPRYSYGFNLGADWNGLDLSVFLQGVGRQHWYPGTGARAFWGPYTRPYATFIPNGFMDDVWSEENPNAYYPRPRGYIALRENRSLGAINDRYLQNIAYLRLKNLTFGYSLPQSVLSKVYVERLRIYFSGENLLTFSKLKSKYIDPEQAAAEDGGNGNARMYGWSKTFSFGVDVTF